MPRMTPSSPPRRSDLRVETSVHDRHKLETSFHFNLRPATREGTRRYRVDLYAFIPASIGINSQTYGSEAFYRHLTSYFRMRTPEFPEWQVADPQELRLPSAEEYLQVHLSGERRRALSGRVVQDVRLFASYVHTRAKRLVEDARGVAREPGGGRRAMWSLLERRAELTAGLLQVFRMRYVDRLKREPILADEDVRRALLLCDEFLSFRLESLLVKLAQASKNCPASKMGPLVERLLAPEADYRGRNGMATPDRGSRQSLEGYTYRLGMLKKFVSEVLYLAVRPENREKVYRNGIAAVGAGLAATFAVLAEQQRLKLMVEGGSGARVGILLALAVVAYVFKDRIKDLSKEYFFERLKHRLPDYKLHLAYRYRDADGGEHDLPLGFAEEFMRYLRADSVPDEVDYLRSVFKRAEVDPDLHETVLHYSRRFELSGREAPAAPGDPRYVKNVLRFDFSEFLARLDEPTRSVEFYDAGRGARRARSHKVYHVNLVWRYEAELDGTARRVDFERQRVILDKRGIVRLERVIPRGELGYAEDLPT